MSLPLPDPALWTAAGVGALAWDGLALQAWGPEAPGIRPALMRVSPDPTRRPLQGQAAARRLLGRQATAPQVALLGALWPLFETSGSSLALPGAAALADLQGRSLAVAVHPEAPAGRFVFPGQPFTDALHGLLHGAVPEGDHLVPCDATAHERLAAAQDWGSDLPPDLEGLGWRRARAGRGIAIACLEEHDLPCVLALAVLPAGA